MKNYAVAIEKWDFDYAQTVLAWLEENFGYRGT